MAGALEHRAVGVAREAPRGGRQRRPRLPAVQWHGRLGGVRRRRAADGGDVVDQRAVGVVADRGDDRHAQQRHRPAQGLVAEREQVGERAAAAGDDDRLDLGHGGEVAERARDRRRRVAVLDRRERPHHPPGPAAAAQPCEDVAARLAALAGDHADAARQGRSRQALLGLEEALGRQRAAQRLELGEQVALAGRPQSADREGERRRRRARARVVVGAAGDDDLGAVGQGARGQPERLERVAPHRAGHGALGVAQLEPHPRAPQAQAEHLAEQLDAGALSQLVAQLGRVRADRKRAGVGRARRCPAGGRSAQPSAGFVRPQEGRMRTRTEANEGRAVREPPLWPRAQRPMIGGWSRPATAPNTPSRGSPACSR